MNGRVAEETGGKKGGKKGSKGSKPDWYGGRDNGVTGNRPKARARVKPDTADDCGEQGHIGVNCPHKVDRQQQKKKMTKARRGNPEGIRSHDGEGGWIEDRHFTTLP